MIDTDSSDAERFLLVVRSRRAVDSIDLPGALAELSKARGMLVLFTLVIGALFLVRALFTAPIYRATAVISVVEDSNGTGGLSGGQIGALASLAGISLGQANSRKSEYLALLTSRSVMTELIGSKNLMPVLFASRWNSNNQSWKPSRFGRPPTLNDGVELLLSKIMTVTTQKATGLIELTAEWRDPAVAADWVISAVAIVNRHVKADIAETAEKSIQYLKNQEQMTDTITTRESINRLIEINLGQIVLANVRSEYALKMIDAPLVADRDKYVRPRPILETVAGAVLGCLGSALFVLARRRSAWWRAAA